MLDQLSERQRTLVSYLLAMIGLTMVAFAVVLFIALGIWNNNSYLVATPAGAAVHGFGLVLGWTVLLSAIVPLVAAVNVPRLPRADAGVAGAQTTESSSERS